MHKLVFFLFIMLATSISYPDELIDDFENGKSRNCFNGEWFYFSDVKDGGNSEILNAELLSGGRYSTFIPANDSMTSGYCAKLEYWMGDVEPLFDPQDGSTQYCNFVAIGTDIARPGGTFDLGPAYGVSFKARSRDSIIIFFELVTSNIYDYAYYRAYFMVTDKWQTFRVNFYDDNQFMIPLNKDAYDIDEHPLMLSKVQKMNWQVAHCFAGVEDLPGVVFNQYFNGHSDTGYLYLDDIVLLDSSTVMTGHPTVRSIKKYDTQRMVSNLMGRRMSESNLLNLAPGLYLMPEKKKLNIHTGIYTPNQ